MPVLDVDCPVIIGPRPGLLATLRERLRSRHYSLRTERAYVLWVRRFVSFHGRRSPRALGAAEVTAFLSSLANQGKVAAATQNQALAAILFLYREVLAVELPWLTEIVRAKKPRRLPTVLSQAEVQSLLSRVEGLHGLMARLMYGTGMRISECVALRVKDLDLERHEIVVRQGKGGNGLRGRPAQRSARRRATRRAGAKEAGRGIIPCATASRRTSCSKATTSAPSRSCWATRT